MPSWPSFQGANGLVVETKAELAWRRMIRSSILKSFGLGLIVFASIACGDNKPPPTVPETMPPSATDGGESTPTSTGDDAGTSGSTATVDTPPPPAAAAKLELPATAAKLKFKSKKEFALEVKSDGTVNNGGKAFAKISGMELQDPAGKPQLRVDADGTITTGEGGAYAKFEGDELSSLVGAKYVIGDDGALGSTDEKGKKLAMGKTEGVGTAKRASLLAVAFAMWGTKAPAPAPAKKAAGKPAGKPAGKK